jgi:hypothetical protein
MFHGHLEFFQKPPLVGRPNTKPGAHGIQMLKTVDLLYFIRCSLIFFLAQIEN